MNDITCRFGNFREILISRIFISRLIGEFLNSRASINLLESMSKFVKILVFLYLLKTSHVIMKQIFIYDTPGHA